MALTGTRDFAPHLASVRDAPRDEGHLEPGTIRERDPIATLPAL